MTELQRVFEFNASPVRTIDIKEILKHHKQLAEKGEEWCREG